MDLLNQVVRNLVILVIVMTFLEMLLPDNKLKSTAKLIFGLMIIATLLNPIVVILNGLGRASFDFTELTFSDGMNYSDDEDINELYTKLTLNQYIDNLKVTVANLLETHTEGYDNEVEVLVIKDFDSKDFGKLIQIDVFLTKKHEGIVPIKPVVIGENNNEKYVEYDDSKEIKDVLKDYFQVSESIINVYIEREEG